MSLPEELIADLDVIRVTPVRGGDIARAYRLDTPSGPVFLKTHPSPTRMLFEREARGLRALREAAPPELRIPEVLAASPRGMVLEWIDEGGRGPATETALGVGLARLHSLPAPHFGGLDGDTSGYLGSVEVDLTPASSWSEFYLERRVLPLTRRAVAEKRGPAEAPRLRAAPTDQTVDALLRALSQPLHTLSLHQTHIVRSIISRAKPTNTTIRKHLIQPILIHRTGHISLHHLPIFTPHLHHIIQLKLVRCCIGSRRHTLTLNW